MTVEPALPRQLSCGSYESGTNKKTNDDDVDFLCFLCGVWCSRLFAYKESERYYNIQYLPVVLLLHDNIFNPFLGQNRDGPFPAPARTINK